MKKFILAFVVLFCFGYNSPCFGFDDDDYFYYFDDIDESKYVVWDRFSDILGQEDIKEEANKIADMIKNSKTYEGLGAKIPNVITIRGEKGTGRTLLAKTIAGEAGAFFVAVEGDDSCKDIIATLVKRKPVVAFVKDSSIMSPSEFIKMIDEIGSKRIKHAVVMVQRKELVDEKPDFFFCCDEDDDQEIDEDKIREKVVYMPPLDRDCREGLLKKFAKQVKTKKSIFRTGEMFTKLATKTANFNAHQLEDLVNTAAIFAGQEYSLSENNRYEVDEKHFYKAYYEVAKDIQSGSGGGSRFVESFYYTYSEETRFSDVLGLDLVLQEVQEYIDILLNGEKYAKIGIKPPRGLLLEGLPGVGKTLIARAIAGEAGCCFISASGAQFINGWVGGGPDSIRSLFKFARNSSPGKPKIVFIDEFDSLGKRPESSDSVANEYRNTINEFLKQMDGFEKNEKILVIAATNNAERLDPAILREGRFDRKVYVPLPDEIGRADILRYYMEQVLFDDSLDEDFLFTFARKCRGFNGAALKTLVNEAAILAIRDDLDIVKRKHFFEAYKKMAPRVQRGLGGDNDEGFHYTFSEETKFKNVIGVEELVNEAKEFIDVLINPKKYKDMGVERQKGLLLYGLPGTGKTLLARAIAGEAGCCFINASASQFVKVFVGAGPAKIRKLFRFARKMAQNKPVIIFFDEIDAFGRRDTFGGSERNNTLNELLTEMDGFSQDENIVVIGATNNIHLVDPALLRDGRFDKKLEIPLPSLGARTKILEYYLEKIKLDPVLSIKEVAERYGKEMRGFSGASLESLVKKAALNAVRNNANSIQEEHLEEAFLTSVLGLKSKLKQTEEELAKTAVHEAGHVLVSVLKGCEVSRVSILSRTNTLGVAFIKDKHEIFSNNTKQDLIHHIMISLGGIAAEKIIYDDITPGCQNDLESANELAFQMVNYYGMGTGWGKDNLEGIISNKKFSETTKEKFDNAVIKLVRDCYCDTRCLLFEHKDELAELSNTLLKKETLSEGEIYQIVGEPRKV